MDPVTVTATISRPREEVFAYLSDVANHAEFTDHWLTDWHLLREESAGTGAGGRFRVKGPFNRFGWADLTLVEVSAPFKIVERGRGGKFNRIRRIGTWTLSPAASGTTRVQYTLETAPATLTDRLIESLGERGRTKRRVAKAMRRLRTILEEGRGRGARATVAGG